MAMYRRCFSLGLAKRRERSRFWMSLIRTSRRPDVSGHVADGHASPEFQGVEFKQEV